MEELRDLVKRNGDVLTVEMEQVRDAYGKGRLGVHVRDNMSKALAGLGIGHYPRPLPDRQWAFVRVYRLGSEIADLIDAVMEPSEEHDEELRKAGGGGAADVLRQIKDIIG